jgi:UDP-N-acetylmuramoyl-tripeptide--D-alanyl-D-alanine ligase
LPAQLVLGFGVDTRALQPGQAFVALQTEKRDGHDFLAAAAAAGAPAALVQRPVCTLDLPQLVVADPLAALQDIGRLHRLAAGAKVIGVSGSAGKTSTKDLLARLLGEPPAVLATAGNLNNHIGVPLTLSRLEPGLTRYAVIEAGINQPGEMRQLAAMIQPDCAIITLVAPAHLERLGSLDAIAHEKSELLRWLSPGGLAVFPWQAWEFEPFRHLSTDAYVAVPAGLVPETPAGHACFVSFAVTHAADATTVTLRNGVPARPFRLRRVSDGMAQNAALALLLAGELGVSDELIQTRLAGWEPARLRGERRRHGAQDVFLDCYNANPASMADALGVFQRLAPPEEPRFYVLGGMEELGPLAADYHRRLGAGLRLRAEDRVVVIGPHAYAVAEGLCTAGNAAAQIQVADTLDAIRMQLAPFAGAVFVKGSRRFQLESLFADEPVLAAVS